MWIDYQLHIYFIYIYIFLFSRSFTQVAIAHSYILSHLLSFIFVYNVTKMVTGLKLQSPKNKNSENRGRKEEGGGGRKGGGPVERGGGALLLFAAHH